MTDNYHLPVMKSEVLDLLAVHGDGLYVDGTLGGGGHSQAMLEAGGKVIGIDRDPEAIRYAVERLSTYGDRFEAHEARFSEMASVVSESAGEVDGVLLDLGISSRMIDEPSRGFSYREDGPLLMTMGEGGTTARDIINDYDEGELVRILRIYGEERRARSIVRAIVARRAEAAVETTSDLADIVERSVGGRAPQKSKARVFQALRIVVNDEIGELKSGLAAALELLAPGGRICVISYHSLEDREVKNFFRDNEYHCICPRGLPICRCGGKPLLKVLTRKAMGPGDEETARNPRARSAKLRAAEKLQAA
jgi:16S rRNA (cytosine1402-N4)-methyltransferase